MKKCYFLLLVFFLLSTRAEAKVGEYKVVSELVDENITLYAKEMDGLYRDFKLVFKGHRYSRPFWLNVTNPTYAPELYYQDIDQDRKKELIIALTKGHGTGVRDEEVYVYRYTNGLIEVLVDHPLAIIYKNTKTKLTTKKAEIIINDKISTVETKSLDPSHLFEDIAFGGILDYAVIDQKLMVRVSAQITPAEFIGDIIIVYEYKDKMYQAKTIEFISHDKMEENPFYGP